MKRLHLFEVEDQAWCPRSLRDALTDYLRFALHVTNPYVVPLPRLVRALRQVNATSITDLCSGGGGPWPKLLPALRTELRGIPVTLTDLYPNLRGFQVVRATTDVEYETRSIDATAPPGDLTGFRTLFTGFHHFRPTHAQRILQSAVDAGRGIAVFEFTERRAIAFMVMLTVPLIVFFTVPFIRPFRWSRILWTYPIPILPLVAMWDGLVSCARSYTVAELQSMTAPFDTYRWDIGTLPAPQGPGRITYLIGVPATS